MNIDNIGKFIKKLREDKGLTQEQLAETIPVSRQAVSKWERGLAIPDSSVLIRLSEIFSVTINEILSGQKITKTNEKEINQVSLKLFKDSNKKRKTIKALVFILIIFAFTFLIYYFIVSYRTIKVYSISGLGNNVTFDDGIFVNTNEKLFFRIGDFDILSEDEEIQNLRLYYLDKSKKEIDIISNTEDSIVFIDFNGYDEYLDTKNITYIINNMYLEIKLKNSTENIKVLFSENYVNGNIFSKNIKNITTNKNYTKNKSINFDDSEIINNIKNNYILEDLNYVYTEKEKSNSKMIIYDEKLNTITLTISNSNKLIEKWFYGSSESFRKKVESR